MSLTFPRLLGGLAILWTLRGLLWGPMAWSTTVSWAIATGLCGLAAAWLVVARQVRFGAALLTAACVIEMLARPTVDNEPAILLGWISAIVLLTEGEPRERAFLLRVCTTAVYAFAAASKTNPTWLEGQGVLGMGTLRDVLGDPLARFYPVSVIALEAWMAVGLWFSRTRHVTAGLGVGLHVGIIAIVSGSVADLLYLIVLNFGLVAMYPSFWFPLRASDVFGRPTAPHSQVQTRPPPVAERDGAPELHQSSPRPPPGRPRTPRG